MVRLGQQEAKLKVDLTADKKKQLMDAYLGLAAFPDVKPGLEALKQQGLKLAILSNGEPKMLEAAARSAGIRDLLDEIISVEEVKIFKTSHRVYWLATERLNVSNPELGFVSANNWDGVAAVSAGLRTFWSSGAPPKFPKNWASRSTRLSRLSRTSQPCCVVTTAQRRKGDLCAPPHWIAIGATCRSGRIRTEYPLDLCGRRVAGLSENRPVPARRMGSNEPFVFKIGIGAKVQQTGVAKALIQYLSGPDASRLFKGVEPGPG